MEKMRPSHFLHFIYGNSRLPAKPFSETENSLWLSFLRNIFSARNHVTKRGP